MTQTQDAQTRGQGHAGPEAAAEGPAGSGLLSGASRVARYAEPAPSAQEQRATTTSAVVAEAASASPTSPTAPTTAPTGAPTGAPAPVTAHPSYLPRPGQPLAAANAPRLDSPQHSGVVRPASGRHTPVTAATRSGTRTAAWGARGRWNRLSAGLLHLAPSAEERDHRDALSTIRCATWTRAVNVMVTNPKGGSGKTPTALILGGILGHIRGGYVAVWEAAESVGSLSRRAEGEPTRGLAELLQAARQIRSAGNLGAFIAPQTSHTDVIGSVADRPVLSAQSILVTRRVLDTYYRVSITDSGNNPHHEAYRAALRTADAVVLPCLVSLDALAGLEEALSLVHATDPAATGAGSPLSTRVVVVLSHDGGPEDGHIAKALHERLIQLGVFAVVEVPFDPAIRLGGEITVADLSEESTRAWTAAAGAVVRALGTAPTDVDLVAALASALDEQAIDPASTAAARPSALTS